jgi:hypothetical protein
MLESSPGTNPDIVAENDGLAAPYVFEAATVVTVRVFFPMASVPDDPDDEAWVESPA